MLNDYGRKIIERLLKRRTDSNAVYHELGSKSQADCDRSHIRVFEAGHPTQRHGDFEHSKGHAAEEVEGKRLIEIAKANGLFIDKAQWVAFGDKKILPSGESIVYLSRDGKNITKVKNPFAKAAIKHLQPSDIIYEHLIHNMLFPNTRYRFLGISEASDGVRIVLTQANIAKSFAVPTQKEIDSILVEGLGLHRLDAYFYGNDFYSITDVSCKSDNVLKGDDGTLFFIDPIIRFEKPLLEVWNYLYLKLK